MRLALAKQRRWPEMLTFEEANMAVPQLSVMQYAVQQVLAEEFKEGFILKGEKLRAELIGKRENKKKV